MSVELAFVVVMAIFAGLVLMEVPVGMAVAASGATGIVLLQGVEAATNVASRSPFTAVAKYSLFVIPMYVLLGALISHAGIAEKIYRAVNRVVRRLPGGLAATAVTATATFSGISGSSSADVATFGRISVREMSRYGYDRAYAAAVVASAGTFAVLIPPSIVLVLYGIIAGENISALLLAGIIPGVLSALILVVFVIVRGYLDQRRSALGVISSSAVPGPEGAEPNEPAPVVDAQDSDDEAPSSWLSQLLALIYAAALFVLVLGGIYSGVFTATEAGAVGAGAALIIAILASRGNDVPLRTVLVRATRETADVTGMIFLLLIGGSLLTFFVARTRIPIDLANWTTGLDVPPGLVVAIILLLMIPLGMFLDGLSIMLLVVPVAAPVVLALGFDGVWFGVLIVKMIEIALLTPPVGINVFIIGGITHIPVTAIFRKVMPFVLLDIAVTALFFAIPDLVLWLPELAGQI